jgi:hypothetical protein
MNTRPGLPAWALLGLSVGGDAVAYVPKSLVWVAVFERKQR